jgi:hypothetical protein
LLRSVNDASPLERLTMTGAADFCSSGRKARVTRTRPKTLVSKVARIESAVSSAAVGIALPARRGSMPALLIVAGDDLRIMVYTAEPGTEDAERLALAVVLGTQALID